MQPWSPKDRNFLRPFRIFKIGIATFVSAISNLKRLQTYLTTSLAVLIVGLSFHTGFIQISYSLNKAYITNNFCVNQDKPEMHCNGKCYLKKQLNKAQDQAPLKDQITNNFSISWIIPDEKSVELAEQSFVETTNTFDFSNEIFDGYLKAIDHPPTQG